MKTKHIRLKIVLLLTVLFYIIHSKIFAQDVILTQAYANPLMLNPAIMGANGDLKVMLNYKSQLRNIDKGYTNSSLGILYPLYSKENKQKLDMGLNVQSDVAGMFRKLDFSMAFGYDLKLTQAGHLSIALLGGFAQKTLSVVGLTFDEQYVNGEYAASNPHSENLSDRKINHQDVGFGVMWYYNPTKTDTEGKLNCFLGVSGFHLNTPNESVTSDKALLPRRFSYQAGIKIIGQHRIDYTPNIKVNLQAGSQEIVPGIYMDYRLSENMKMTGGIWIKTNGASAFLLGFDHRNLSFGYSYDLYLTSGIGKYMSNTNASQISLIYRYGIAAKKGVTMDVSPFSSF